MTPATQAIEVRDLHFGLSESTPRYWYDGDPGKTHLMNALSTTFPAGEAFFVRSVRFFRERIRNPELLDRIRGFSGQEAVHSREHAEHVRLLVSQGYRGIEAFNRQEERELRFWNRRAPVWSLAITASLEHLTAIMARQALSDPEYWAAPMHEDMAPLWQWHAIEEAEHKAVAFDVLTEVAPNYGLRVRAMAVATLSLLMDNLARWLYFTAKDGNLLRPRVWASTFRFLWGRDGLYRRLVPDYRRWYGRDFHPDQQDDRDRIAQGLARLKNARAGVFS